MLTNTGSAGKKKHGCSCSKSQLLLHCNMANDYPVFPAPIQCRYLSAFCASGPVPDMDVVNSMLAYARKAQSSDTAKTSFPTFLMQGMRNQIQCYYLVIPSAIKS